MSTPWFEDKMLAEATSVSGPETKLLKHFALKGADGKDAQLDADSTEFGDTVWSRTRGLVLPFSIVVGLLAIPVAFASYENAHFLVVAGLGLLFLMALSAVLSFGEPLRAMACGKAFPFGDAAKTALSRFPNVALATVLAFCAVSLGLMMCIVPGLLILPFVVRAPYEAALGHSLLQSFERSIWISSKVTSTGPKISNFVLNAAIAIFAMSVAARLVTGTFGVSGLWGVGGVGVIGVTIAVAIAPAILAVFVIQDAALAGSLRPNNLAAVRLPSTSWWNRNRYGRMGSTIRLVFTLGGWFYALSVHLALTSVVLEPGTSAPTFALSDLEGQTHQLMDYNEHPTVVYFWAPWCGPCKSQVPELNDLQKERDDVNVVAVAMQFEDEKQLETYVEDKGVEYQVLMGTDELFTEYQLTAFPSIIMLDTDARVLWSQTGVASTEDMIDVLDSVADSPAEGLN